MKTVIIIMFIGIALAFAVFLAAGAGNVFAQNGSGLFELDGNAAQDATPPPDDWETLYGGGGSVNVFTGVNSDPSPQSVFTGDRKDGSVPDKDGGLALLASH